MHQPCHGGPFSARGVQRGHGFGLWSLQSRHAHGLQPLERAPTGRRALGISAWIGGLELAGVQRHGAVRIGGSVRGSRAFTTHASRAGSHDTARSGEEAASRRAHRVDGTIGLTRTVL